MLHNMSALTCIFANHLSCADPSGVVGRERMGTAFPHNNLNGNREFLRDFFYCYY